MATSPPWQEPPLAESSPMVTGYPIEALPPSKLLPKQTKKKPRKLPAGIPPHNSLAASESGSDDTPSSGPEFLDIESSSDGEHLSGKFPDSGGVSDVENSHGPSITPPPEQKLKLKLKTSLFHDLVEDSNIRRRSRRNSGADVNYYEMAKIQLGMVAKRPRTPTKEELKTSEPHPALKRIKISSPKKSSDPAGYALTKQESFARQARQATATASLTEDKTIENQDFCSVCGGAGKFLCCETCPRSFHFSCVDPPLDDDSLPEGEWHCHECYTKRHPQLPYQKGFLFTKLLNHLQRRNPKQFQLPKKLRDRYENISVNKEGEYQEEFRGATGKKLNHNRQEGDPLKLYGKNGDVALCYSCQKSALNGTEMVNCDFCDSHWHVDCLDPPLYAVGPTWKCPNHADQAARLPRRPRKAKLRDVSLRRGFKNEGNIEIYFSDEESDETVQKLPFFDIRDRPGQVYAPIPKHIGKTFTIDDVVYRLPADGVRLDFIDAVHNANNDPLEETITSDILVALDELALRPQEEREGVRDLCFLSMNGSKHVIAATAKENLLTLLDAALNTPADALDSTEKDNNVHTPGIKQEESGIVGRTSLNSEEDIKTDELKELLAIKKLMLAKGKDSMMKFLLQ